LSLQQLLKYRLFRLFSFKNNTKSLLIFYFLISFFIIDLSKAENNKIISDIDSKFTIDYLNPKKKLVDYIIDTGDELYINFYPATELTDTYVVNSEGEILLPRLNETYVRGLTTSELKELLERRYLEFLLNPEIKVSIAVFRPSKVLVKGEVRYEGVYEFPAYKAAFANSYLNEETEIKSRKNLIPFNKVNKFSEDNFLNESINIEESVENIVTISDVIRKAGGITSLTDLSKIEIIRDVPFGKGGGKKRAVIDLNSFINESDNSNDLRIFDGDILFLPRLSKASTKQIPKSILSGLSPKFITVSVFGQIEKPGDIKLPLGATLSDAFDMTGPIKPLSGKVILFRYQNDGTLLRKKISYSERGKRGSKSNPLIKEGDFISVKNSILGKSTGFMKEFTAPFVGINAAKELFDKF